MLPSAPAAGPVATSSSSVFGRTAAAPPAGAATPDWLAALGAGPRSSTFVAPPAPNPPGSASPRRAPLAPGQPGPGAFGLGAGASGALELLLFATLLATFALAVPRLSRWLRLTPDAVRLQYIAPIEVPG
jgi:hypothetical protein